MTSIYEPREDSELIRRHIAAYAKGRVLDVGTGSGLLALEAARSAREVLAADVNAEAVDRLSSVAPANVRALRSDLFSAVRGRFDLIVCNPPYLPDEPADPDPALDGGAHGWEWTVRFVRDAKAALEAQGVILLVSSTRTSLERVERAFAESAFSARIIDEIPLPYERLVLYEARHDDPHRVHWGRRSVVFARKADGVRMAIKRMHPVMAHRARNEAQMLAVLNTHGIGPRLLGACEGEVWMEWRGGMRIIDALARASERSARSILAQVLSQLRILDELGIEKGELANPYKHIIVDGDRVVLIDFERAHHVDDPANLTQFSQFCCRKAIHGMLAEKGLMIDVDSVREAARTYKREPSEERFERLKRELIPSSS